MQYIKQEHKLGCGVACLAMLTNQSYEDVLQDISNVWNENRGLYKGIVESYLLDRDYLIKPIYKCCHWNGSLRDPWPIQPFAEKHLIECRVNENSPCYHFIVMDGTGKLYDPALGLDRTYKDYLAILSITGVYCGRSHI